MFNSIQRQKSFRLCPFSSVFRVLFQTRQHLNSWCDRLNNSWQLDLRYASKTCFPKCDRVSLRVRFRMSLRIVVPSSWTARPLRSFETSGPPRPTTQRPVPDYLNLQKTRSENLIIVCFLFVGLENTCKVVPSLSEVLCIIKTEHLLQNPEHFEEEKISNTFFMDFVFPIFILNY